jgi:hypothetical protein
MTEFACRPHCLAASAGKVYLAGEGCLLVADISEQGRPRVIGYAETGSNAPRGLTLQDGFGYLSDRSGLAIFDLSDPQHPRQTGFCPVDSAGDLLVEGKYAYLCGFSGGKWGLHVVDVSDPAKPKIAGRRPLLDFAPPDYRLALRGRMLYLGTKTDLWAFNVSDPSKIRETLHQSGNTNLSDLIISYDYLCLTQQRDDRNVLSIYGVAGAAPPEEVGTLDLRESASHRLALSGTNLYSLGSNGDVYVIGMAPANTPRIMGRYHLPASENSRLAVVNARAYVCDPDFGLWILDFSSPGIPVLEKSWNLPDRIAAVHVSGKVGCVVSKDLRTLDLSDPRAPKETGIFPLPGRGPVSVTFGLNAIYVAAGSMISVIDVTYLDDPQAVGRIKLNSQICDIAVSGKLAAVACRDGLHTLDLTNPLLPAVKGHLGSPKLSGCSAVELADRYAYVIEPGLGLKLVDLKSAKNPSVSTKLELPDAKDLAVMGDYVYILNENAISITSIKDKHKLNPVERLFLSEPQKIDRISAWGNHLLLSGPEAGLWIYDLTNPEAPAEAGHLKTKWPLNVAALQGDMIYTAEERWVGMYEMTISK